MPAEPQQLRATGEYRKIQNESRTAAADPMELVSLLYEELEIALGVLMALCRRQAPLSATDPARRARMILIALDGGLDHAAGGDLAASLSHIYVGMRQRLDRAIAERDARRLGEICEGVQSLAAA